MDIEKANNFFRRFSKELKLNNLKCNKHVQGSQFFHDLCDRLFGLAFFYDCINKGYKVQKTLLEENIISISKTANPDRILAQFNNFKEQNHIILIAAYEQFIFYLYTIIREFYLNNKQYLYCKDNLSISTKEVVKSIDDGTLIEKIINIKICKNVSFSLVTDFQHWVNLLKSVKVSLEADEISFLELFHFRRNAASHLTVHKQWLDIKGRIEYANLIIWLYGILHISLKIDSMVLPNLEGIKTIPITLNLFERGEFIFETT